MIRQLDQILFSEEWNEIAAAGQVLNILGMSTQEQQGEGYTAITGENESIL